MATQPWVAQQAKEESMTKSLENMEGREEC